jgi:hypothetical protein
LEWDESLLRSAGAMLGRKDILSLHSRTANPNLVVVSREHRMHEL